METTTETTYRAVFRHAHGCGSSYFGQHDSEDKARTEATLRMQADVDFWSNAEGALVIERTTIVTTREDLSNDPTEVGFWDLFDAAERQQFTG